LKRKLKVLADFKKKYIEDVIVEKVNLFKATLSEVEPFWQKLNSDNVFGFEKIIIDLSLCNFVDSTFKGIIVKAFRKIKVNNGEMKLVLPKLEALDSFKLSGITNLIESFEDLDSAIASYGIKTPKNKFSLSFTANNFESTI
jgi:hypothetical protein